jgi:hypothetical protein
MATIDDRASSEDRGEPKGRCEPSLGVCAREIAQDQWTEYLDQFSQDHTEAPVSVEIRGESAGGAHWLTHELPLLGLVPGVDRNARSVELILGDPVNGPLTHVIRDVQKVWQQQDEKGRDVLQFISRGGTTTILTTIA